MQGIPAPLQLLPGPAAHHPTNPGRGLHSTAQRRQITPTFIPNLINPAKKLLVERRNKGDCSASPLSCLAVTLPVGAGVPRWGCQTAHTDTRTDTVTFPSTPTPHSKPVRAAWAGIYASSPRCSPIPARASCLASPAPGAGCSGRTSRAEPASPASLAAPFPAASRGGGEVDP